MKTVLNAAVVAFVAMTALAVIAEELIPVGPVPDTAKAFAMDTSVFTEETRTPLVSTTTVFVGRRAYDRVAGEAGAVARFDFDKQVIDLVDSANRVRTVVTFNQLLEFQAAQAALSEVQKDREPFGKFLATPTFTSEFGATIKLRSPWLTYEAKGSRSTPDVVDRFVEFADWSARLGCRMNPNGPPARARLELNAALKKQNWKVSRITRTGGPKARMLGVVRSEHVYRHQLSADDQHLISRAEKSLESFRQISFSEFHAFQNSATVAAKK